MTNTDWREQAACNTEDPELWFPNPGERQKALTAIAICKTCPVITECKQFTDRIKPGFGIWAGRARITKEHGYKSDAEYRPCGSPGPAGARKHRRRGEPVCPQCQRADTNYHAEIRARRQGMNG